MSSSTMDEPAIQNVVSALADEFSGIVSRRTVKRCIADCLRRPLFDSAQVTHHVPVLVERFGRERLWAGAQVEGRVTKDKPEVLFVCVHNAGRSQTAALTAHLSGGRVHVRSAGSEPAGRINPAVVTVMEELGLDLSREFPKPLTDEAVQAADVVITMGCGDACPIYPGKR